MTLAIDDFEVHPDAAAELEAAVDSYLGYGPDSAERFLVTVRKQLNGIREWPNAGPKWPGWEREPMVYSYGVRGYPYRIVYFYRDDEPVVYAHEKRLPGYWKSRVAG